MGSPAQKKNHKDPRALQPKPFPYQNCIGCPAQKNSQGCQGSPAQPFLPKLWAVQAKKLIRIPGLSSPNPSLTKTVWAFQPQKNSQTLPSKTVWVLQPKKHHKNTRALLPKPFPYQNCMGCLAQKKLTNPTLTKTAWVPQPKKHHKNTRTLLPKPFPYQNCMGCLAQKKTRMPGLSSPNPSLTKTVWAFKCEKITRIRSPAQTLPLPKLRGPSSPKVFSSQSLPVPFFITLFSVWIPQLSPQALAAELHKRLHTTALQKKYCTLATLISWKFP